MMFLHDSFRAMNESTLTERGQISVPAAVRKALHLRPGQRLRFEAVSANEFRVFAAPRKAAGPLSVLGYARNLGKAPRPTKEWMKELREGES
jgi:AbrB family looped-hinge helix DNA binding protein